MPLIGVLVGGPISLTASLFLASYGALGPYGGFWRLFFAGLAASVPVFAIGGVLFAPVEIWLAWRPQRIAIRKAALLRCCVLALTGAIGAFVAHDIVVRLLAAPPPPTLFTVLLVTYSLIGTIIGLSYTLYDEYIHQIRVSTQLTEEMRVARSIQRGLFPRECPQVPGYTIAAHCQPAHETGGDFYDFVKLENGRLGLVIADVAGKGMPAALLMANARSTWRAEARNSRSAAETLKRVNRSLYYDINSNTFVTLLYAILDPVTHQLHLSNAGHPLPLHYNDHPPQEVEIFGLPLGLQPDAVYSEKHIALQPGDTVFLYTDGIIEALNSSRELFGYERLVEFIQREGRRTAGTLAKRTLLVARTFTAQDLQADDMTVLVLKAHL
jgi:hypothetical protein